MFIALLKIWIWTASYQFTVAYVVLYLYTNNNDARINTVKINGMAALIKKLETPHQHPVQTVGNEYPLES